MAAPLFPLLRRVSHSADADPELLDRFAANRDQHAFAEIVRRHSTVVYRVCRRLAGPVDADDAFQATFLLLATRVAAARSAPSVGGWLVGVAGRVARQHWRPPPRRARHEAVAAERVSRPARPLAPCDPDRILDEELSRLPERLRRPLVLCLADYTQDRAAAELGYTPRTLRRRLEQAKQLLRTRLEKRGLAPAVAATLVAGVGGTAPAAPDGLGTRAVAAMNEFLTGRTSPPVVLANGVVQGMIARKLTMLVAVAAVGLAALGSGLAEGWTRASAQQVVPAANESPPPGMVPTSPAARATGRPPAGRDAGAGDPVRVGQRYSFGTADFTFMGGGDSVEVLEVEGQWVRVRLWEREPPARGEAFPWINLNQTRVLIPRGPAKKEK